MLEDGEGDYIGDIEKISKLNDQFYVFIDGYEQYSDLFEHFGKYCPSNINLILTSRTSEHERGRQELRSYNIQFNELNIDILSETETIQLISIIDNLGYWGEKANYSRNKKISLIKEKYKSQISLTLLSIFNSPHIKEKISKILLNIFNNEHMKKAIFSICLLEIIDVPLRSSLISEVTDSNFIYSSELRENEYFKQIFKMVNGSIVSKSSLFSRALLKNHFSPSYIIEQFLNLVERYEKKSRSDFIEQKIFRKLLIFSFIERALPDTNKRNNISRYYEMLKTRVTWLQYEPHYWLQYAMSRIMFDDYENAQKFLDQAYSIGNNKYKYDLSNIDTQQARLYILLSVQEKDANKSFLIFQKAHKLLSKINNDIYKFRQVTLYNDIFENNFSSWSNKNNVFFEHACKKMLQDINKADLDGVININEHKTVSIAHHTINVILDSITANR